MQPQHANHLRSYLESMDGTLEQYEMRLRLDRKYSSALRHVTELRKSIQKFLAYIGVQPAKRNICNEINTSCLFFENYLVDMEPKRFQKGYGKLDSENEKTEIEKLLVELAARIRELERATSK